MAISNENFDWAATKSHIATLSTYEEKVLYLLAEIERFKNRDWSGGSVLQRMSEGQTREARKMLGTENYADKCRDELERLKLLHDYLPNITSQLPLHKNQPSTQLPIDTLHSIFYPNAVDSFIELEKKLIQFGYFKSDNTWQKEKEVLASLILNLQKKGYIRKRGRKSEAAFKKQLLAFFQDRYHINVSKQLQDKYVTEHRVLDKFPFLIDPL